MKILYAVQGIGNGHMTRATEIIPVLEQLGHVDVLVSGSQSEIKLSTKPTYICKGISFVFGKGGGINIWKTILLNRTFHFLREMRSLPVDDYDLIINDFEPISAWAAKGKKVPIISLSHQSALLQEGVPRPTYKDWLGSWVLQYYAPIKNKVSFHFQQYNPHIFTPIMRSKVRNAEVSTGNHIAVYLPAYSDEKIIKVLKYFQQYEWHLFSKNTHKDYTHKNIKVFTLDDDRFIDSMAKSQGVLCGAGFETPAEALFLEKKLMVVPMKNQYEQHFNAVALEKMGVPVLPAFKKKYKFALRKWLKSSEHVQVNYQPITQKAVDALLFSYHKKYSKKPDNITFERSGVLISDIYNLT